MGKLSGPISDRLRRLFSDSDPVYNPGRPADVKPKKQPVPKHVEGHKTGKRHAK